MSDFMVGGDHLTCYSLLCYHADFSKSTLHKESNLQSSPFFTQILKALRQFVCTQLPWSSTSYTPKLTGACSELVVFYLFIELNKSISVVSCIGIPPHLSLPVLEMIGEQ